MTRPRPNRGRFSTSLIRIPQGAWNHICKRPPRCVEWNEAEVRALVPEDKLARTIEIIGKISYRELMRFRIGLDGIPNRPPGIGDSAISLVVEAEKNSLLAPTGFITHSSTRRAGRVRGRD